VIPSVVTQSVTTLLVGAGMTLVIATGGVDLSVGSVMAVSSAVAVTLLPHGALAALGAGLAVGAAAGAVNGLLVARYGVLPILVTLATMIIGRGIAQVIVAGNPLVVFTDESFERLGKGYVGCVPVQVVVAALVVALVAVGARATALGRYVVAVGGNENAAWLAGVPVGTVKLAVYCASGVLAALAGLVETARLAATDAGTIGAGVELDAIVACVVGGTALSGGRARVLGTAVGALLMSALSAALAIHLVAHPWALVAKASLLLGVVYMQRWRRA
jgi:ribose/xylose/arabinose/galactoside ABC-type transport system permease subunit